MGGKLELEKQLAIIIEGAVRQLAEKEGCTLPDNYKTLLETPKEERFGELSCNAAMQLAKAFRSNPKVIAAKITELIEGKHPAVEKTEIAGAGFINFYLKKQWYYDELALMISRGEDYGSLISDKPKTINVEYVSSNPTGPCHIGNARGGAIGDVIANVYRKAGWEVTKEFYLNDAGNQIKKFGESIYARYKQLTDPDFPFPEDGYKGQDVAGIAERFAKENPEADKMPKEELTEKAIAFGLENNVGNIRRVLEKYGINYDVWFSESTLHESGAITKAIDFLRDKGAVYEKDGAVWFKATDYNCEKDEVLIRSNGIPTYFASDIAYHLNKLKERNFDLAVNVWGADHHGHVHRLRMSMAAAGIDPERLRIVLMQLVHLVRGNETLRMSKRRGDMVTLDELLEEVPVDAVRYIFNSTNPNSHLDFDMDLAVKNTLDNPVFYVQYAHARICSILRNVPPANTPADYTKLTDKTEIALLAAMADYSGVIKTAADEFDPSKITKYVYDLASCFHSFYNACRVKNEDASLMNARLMLITACKNIIKSALTILGVSAPEEM